MAFLQVPLQSLPAVSNITNLVAMTINTRDRPSPYKAFA